MFDFISLVAGLLPMEGAPVTDVISSMIKDADGIIRAAISVAIIAFIGFNVLKTGFSLGRIVALLVTAGLVIWALMYDGITDVAQAVSSYFDSLQGK